MAINRFYSTSKFQSRQELLRYGIKCVFISYQRDDKEAARKVAEYLEGAGIDIYFDEYDSDLKSESQLKNPKKVTDAICRGINNSSHMLVLASPSTLDSAWVPFEIGYGYDKTDLAVLCLKGIQKGKLPEYVRTAKVIRDIYDLNKIIIDLTNNSESYLVESRRISNYNSSYHPLSNVMESFITES